MTHTSLFLTLPCPSSAFLPPQMNYTQRPQNTRLRQKGLNSAALRESPGRTRLPMGKLHPLRCSPLFIPTPLLPDWATFPLESAPVLRGWDPPPPGPPYNWHCAQYIRIGRWAQVDYLGKIGILDLWWWVWNCLMQTLLPKALAPWSVYWSPHSVAWSSRPAMACPNFTFWPFQLCSQLGLFRKTFRSQEQKGFSSSKLVWWVLVPLSAL